MRTLPTRESVVRKPLMHHHERRLDRGIEQVGVEPRNLVRDELAPVDDGRALEAAYVEKLSLVEPKFRAFVGDAFADDVELALERFLVPDRLASADEHLAYRRNSLMRDHAALRVVDRHRAPSQKTLSLFANHPLENFLTSTPLLRVERHEDHPDAVLARSGQSEAELFALLDEEFVRNLHQDARAVSRQRVASAGAAMCQVVEHLQ